MFEKRGGWIPRDGFNWISNRKRIVKTRFGYVFVSKGDVSVKRRGGRRCAPSVVYYCYRFVVLVVVRIENLISLLLSFCAVIRFKGDMKKKSVRALINLRFECISYFRIV